jgi:hypothetical protein
VRAVKLNYKFEVYGRMDEQEIAGDATGLKATNRGEYRWRKKMDKVYIVVLNSTTYGKWGTLKGYAQGSGNYP